MFFREDFLETSPAIWYNLAQTGVYAVMALGIMRLKLFLTPHLCIIAGLLVKEKVILSHFYMRHPVLF